MPQIIEHRRNTCAQLSSVDSRHGVEIDLRSDVTRPQSLHLAHDPYVLGEDFDTWIRQFKKQGVQGPLILNTKEDGLEEQVSQRLAAQHIDNYFFLDTAPATLVKRCQAGLGAHMAARLSSFEPVGSLSAYEGLTSPYRPAWLWVDCFGGTPVEARLLGELAPHYRVCLVSPELHGFHTDDIVQFQELWGLAEAICTKVPARWAF